MTEYPSIARVIVLPNRTIADHDISADESSRFQKLARFVGRPLEENPYDSIHGREQHEAWRWAWRFAGSLLENTGEAEVRRWLEEAAS